MSVSEISVATQAELDTRHKPTQVGLDVRVSVRDDDDDDDDGDDVRDG